ncbi:uncharacterized protein LOC133409080 isoform X1 [Phycodurus eques]|uniref:uncharacterized protein LOC133409080 isoform X1 n=1 Tax=Phycodurus eques TaxID=693459 RepID=UPI002ACEF92B|nr:uncharacterized protein LOC133409080 isoform X1 [Phycodurus eques]
MPLASKANESKMDGRMDGSYQINSVHFQDQCPPLPSPRLGNHIINAGNGRSVGTTISLQCPTKHRLVGGELKCVMDANRPRWVGEPSCKPLSLYKDSGFRVAVLASIVSIGIIFIMSMMFLTCCILDCVQKNTRKKRGRDSFKRHLEDGMSCYSLEGGCDIDIPENLCDNSPPQWFTYGLGQTNAPTPPRPSGFYDNQHPIPQKSDCVQVLGPPHYIAISPCCKCSSSGLVQIPTEETDLVWQPYSQQLRSTQRNP